MNEPNTRSPALELRGLDGANPLGFLAALGTLVTLHGLGEAGARLSWRRGRTWEPVIEGVSVNDPAAFSELVARGLRGKDVSADADARRNEAQKAFEAAGTAVKKQRDDIKKRRLPREERARAIEAHVLPLEAERERKREAWLRALADAVPRQELSLGKRIDCTSAEYRQRAHAFLAGAAQAGREALDLLAAFGSDARVQEKSDAIEPTPFQFVTGSGHQFFLETVRHLIENVAPERVRSTLFDAWTYPDQGLSLRWDPVEDRRYALMDRDPTASDNKSQTMWMANLLAYRSLVLFPAAAGTRTLRVTGWVSSKDETAFAWPMWEFSASADMIRSLLQLREIAADDRDGPILRARGIAAVFRARRIKVGAGANYKLNFSPARQIL
jgi:hypothetical protein